MMVCDDRTKAPGSETKHHSASFIDRIPANPRLEPADGLEAGSGVHLDRAASVKLRRCSAGLVPSGLRGLVQDGAGDAQSRVLAKFGYQRFKHLRTERHVSIQPQDKVVFAPDFAGQELHDDRFATESPLTVAWQVMDFNPGVRFAGVIQNCRGVVGGAVIYDYPTL